LLCRLLNITERSEPNLKSVALGTFLETCIAVHTERAAVQGITMHHRAHVEQGCFDPEQMRSALDNLILNAIAASPAGSQVVITAELQGMSLIFSVSD
jgi:signal transduction histidine kinase